MQIIKANYLLQIIKAYEQFCARINGFDFVLVKWFAAFSSPIESSYSANRKRWNLE